MYVCVLQRCVCVAEITVYVCCRDHMVVKLSLLPVGSLLTTQITTRTWQSRCASNMWTTLMSTSMITQTTQRHTIGLWDQRCASSAPFQTCQHVLSCAYSEAEDKRYNEAAPKAVNYTEPVLYWLSGIRFAALFGLSGCAACLFVLACVPQLVW